jgi:hypothetical protein
MPTTDLDAKIGIQMLDGDRIHTHVGGAVSIDAGYRALFWNQNSTKLGTLEIIIESADDFDSLVAGTSDSVRFSNGLEVGSNIDFIFAGSSYLASEIVQGSSKSHLKIKINGDGYFLGQVIHAIEYKNSASDINYNSKKSIIFNLSAESGVNL